ncbi:MAG: DNA translocase FtsK 4TM domain-containing protein [Kiritimatiellia bacterium]
MSSRASQQSLVSPDSQPFRRLVGGSIALLMVFPILALLTYDWRDIPQLCSPANNPPHNAIGLVGAWLTFYGYSLLGIGYWLLPLAVLGHSILQACGRMQSASKRIFLLAGIQIVVSSLIQLRAELFRPLLANLNLLPNAGGAVGYWLVTCALERLISPVGTAILLVILLAVLLLLLVGVRTAVALLVRGVGAVGSAFETYRESRRKRLEETLPHEASAAQLERIRAAQEEARLARADERATSAVARSPKELQKQRETNLRRKQEESAKALRRQREAQRQPVDTNPQEPEEATSAPPTCQPPDQEVATNAPYPLPPLDLLDPPSSDQAEAGDVDLIKTAVVDCLAEFKIDVQVTNVVSGPVVTQFELLPSRGVPVNAISGKSKDLMMRLAAKSLRIQAPIPGKGVVGLEIPNAVAKTVTEREILEGKTWQEATRKFRIPMSIGKDAEGKDLVADLADMPHLLVAGTTGSGKSVCVNSIIVGLLMSRRPEEVRFIMIDPKRVEFAPYDNLPHLLVPVITDIRKVAFGLQWAVVEMERRYRILEDARCRSIVEYNRCHQTVLPLDQEMAERDTKPMPYIVVVVDEVAEIMNADKQTAKHAENCIARLTAKSRAVGIHLILATQRPSTDVITGQIKGNIAGRIALKVSSGTDSRIILDDLGAETLIGRGDMLFKNPKVSHLVRAQSAFMRDEELARVIAYIKEHCPTSFDEDLRRRLASIKEADPNEELEQFGGGGEEKPQEGAIPAPEGVATSGPEDNPLYAQAIEVLRRTRRASTSSLQRNLKIGYNTAANLMDMLEENGVVGPSNGAAARTILVDLDNYAPSGVTDLELHSDNESALTAEQEGAPAEPAEGAEK